MCCTKWVTDLSAVPKLTIGKFAALPAYQINISEVIISSLFQLLTLDCCQRKATPSKMIPSTLGKAIGNWNRLFFSQRSVCSLVPNGTSAPSTYKWSNMFFNPPTTVCIRSCTKLHLANILWREMNQIFWFTTGSSSHIMGKRRQQLPNWTSALKKWDFTCTLQQD